jgi:threonine dehydrogenase-like Zn-dependent dehydrogenase
MTKGYYPFTGVPGHEFVGDVEVAPDSPSWVGKRVVGEINVACGSCLNCRRGLRHHCEQRAVLGLIDRHGAFAESLVLPVANLHEVPDPISDRAAVFCEPLAAALEIQQQVQIHPADTVLVIGAGRLGQLVAQTLAMTGCDLRVIVRYEAQRSLLAARGIATVGEEEIIEGHADVVVEASGSPDGFALALRAVRPQGIIVLKSTYKDAPRVHLSSLVVNELKLVGSRCGPLAAALRLLENKAVEPLPLLTGSYPLREALQAFEHASQPGALKVLLEIGGVEDSIT